MQNMVMLNPRINKLKKELGQKRRADRALATQEFDKHFPVPGLYYIRELGSLKYQHGRHHQYAVVNWRPTRNELWLEEVVFTINLAPLLVPIAIGPKDITYKSLLNKIIRVTFAGRRSEKQGSRIIHADIADWKIMETFDFEDRMLMTSPEAVQIILEADMRSLEEEALMNAVLEDSLVDDLPDEEPVDSDQIPEDDIECLLDIEDHTCFLDYEGADDEILIDDEPEENEDSDPKEPNT